MCVAEDKVGCVCGGGSLGMLMRCEWKSLGLGGGCVEVGVVVCMGCGWAGE